MASILKDNAESYNKLEQYGKLLQNPDMPVSKLYKEIDMTKLSKIMTSD